MRYFSVLYQYMSLFYLLMSYLSVLSDSVYLYLVVCLYRWKSKNSSKKENTLELLHLYHRLVDVTKLFCAYCMHLYFDVSYFN